MENSIVLQEKSCIITGVQDWKVSEELSQSSNPKYSGQEGKKFVSVTFASKGEKNPMKISLDPEEVEGLEFGDTGLIEIIFHKG